MPSSPAERTAASHPAPAPEDWLDEHGDVLFAFALARVGRRDVAEDLVQETLLAAIEAQARFEGRSSERTWLVGILKRRASAWKRRQRFTSEEGLARLVEAQFSRRGKWISSRPKRSVPSSRLNAK